MADNLKMAVEGTTFYDGVVNLSWGTGGDPEVVAVPPANRSAKLVAAIAAGSVVETADDVTPVPSPSTTRTFVQLSTEPDDGQTVVFNSGTGKFDPSDFPAAVSLTDIRKAGISFVIEGGGSAITTGIKGYIEVPYAGTITAVRLLGDQVGSIVVDIWKDSYANYPPTVADTICASAKPTLSTAIKSQDTTLTGWTTGVALGDILAFKVDSITDCQRVTVALAINRTVS